MDSEWMEVLRLQKACLCFETANCLSTATDALHLTETIHTLEGRSGFSLAERKVPQEVSGGGGGGQEDLKKRPDSQQSKAPSE
jgi:hypothetical protein